VPDRWRLKDDRVVSRLGRRSVARLHVAQVDQTIELRPAERPQVDHRCHAGTLERGQVDHTIDVGEAVADERALAGLLLLALQARRAEAVGHHQPPHRGAQRACHHARDRHGLTVARPTTTGQGAKHPSQRLRTHRPGTTAAFRTNLTGAATVRARREQDDR